jgi:hypothetical protein
LATSSYYDEEGLTAQLLRLFWMLENGYLFDYWIAFESLLLRTIYIKE